MKKTRKVKSIILLAILIFSIAFNPYSIDFYKKVFTGELARDFERIRTNSIQEQNNTITWGYNVIQNLPYYYQGTYYETTDYDFSFTNAYIDFEYIPDSSLSYSYPVSGDFDNHQQEYPVESEITSTGNNPYYDIPYIGSNDDDNSIFSGEGKGVYNATYSFSDELDDTSGTNIDFVDIDDITPNGGDAYIVDQVDGHNKVIYVNPTVAYRMVQNEVEETIVRGTIESWFYIIDDTDLHRIDVFGSAGNAIALYFYYDGTFRYYYDGDRHQSGSLTYNANEWNHLKVGFNFGDHTYNLTLNGELGDDDLTMYSTGSGSLGGFRFGAGYGDMSPFYADAIGYSWDSNYEIGDNTRDSYPLYNYPGTYSFDDQPVWTEGNDINMLDGHSTGFNAQIIDNVGYHKSVMNCSADSGWLLFQDDFSQQTSGTIEYWIRLEDDDTDVWTQIRGGSNDKILFYFENGDHYIKYMPDGSTYINIQTWTTDTWYHFKIDFDCNTQLWNLWIDGEQMDSEGYPFYGTPTYINQLMMNTGSQFGGCWYLDAFGYSWDSNYNIGDNYWYNYYIGTDIFEGYNMTNFFGDYYGTESFKNYVDREIGNYNGTYSFEPWNMEMEEGVYYGTYDFRDESSGDYTSSPTTLDFVDYGDIDADCYLSVEDEVAGHKKVLNLTDNSGSGCVEIRNTFSSAQEIGTVDFWIRGSDVSYAQYIYIEGSVKLRSTSDKWQYYNGTDWLDISDTSILDDIWYHVVIDFNCSTDTYDFILNGELKGDDLVFHNTDTSLDTLFLLTGTSNSGFEYYFDAFGYSWDSSSHSGLGYENNWNINGYDLVPILDEGFSFNFHYGMNVSIEDVYELHNFVLKVKDYYYSNTEYYEGTEDFDNYLNYLALSNYYATENFDFTMAENYYYGTYDFRDLSTTLGTYYATYDFRDETTGTENSAIGFITGGSYPTDTLLSIVESSNGHNKVMKYYDNNGADDMWTYSDFSQKTTGVHTIEWWMMTDDVTKYSRVGVVNSGWSKTVGFVAIDNSDFITQDYSLGSITIPNSPTPVNNIWYHIKFVFDMDNEKVHYYINGTDSGELNTGTSGLDNAGRFTVNTYNGDSGYSVYIDAVGYDWDITSHSGLGYKVGYNLNSYDIEPLLEHGVDINNLNYTDYVSLISSFNSHYYVSKIYGSSLAMSGDSGNTEEPAVWGDFSGTYTGDTVGTIGSDDSTNTVVGSVASAGSESSGGYLDPSNDAYNNGWVTAPLYGDINDGVRDPTTSGFSDGSISGQYAEYCYFDTTDTVSIPANNYITKVVIHAYTKNNADPEYYEFLEATWRIEGVTGWQSAQSVSGMDWGWRSKTWSGLWSNGYDEADADNIQIRLQTDRIMADTTIWYCEALYAEVFYAPAVYDMDYTITFNIPGDATSFGDLYYEYKTTAAVAFQMQIYDWTTGYDNVETHTTTSWYSGTVDLTSGDYVQSGTNNVRVHFHRTAGASSTDTDQYIDYLYATYSTIEIDNAMRSTSIYDTFSKTSGTIDFWTYFTGTDYNNKVLFNNDTFITHHDSHYYWVYSNDTEVDLGALAINQWIHFSITFTDNDVDVYINGVQYDVVWSDSATTLTRIDFMSFDDEPMYVDAIGYSWDNTSHSGLGYGLLWNINPYDIEPMLNDGFFDEYMGHYEATIRIVDLEGHSNVLLAYHGSYTSTYSRPLWYNLFSGKSTGIVEFWLYTNGTTYNMINLGSNDFQMYAYGSNLYYTDGGGQLVCSIDQNEWIHIRLDFDCNSGVDSFCDIYVDGVLEVDDAGFNHDVSSIGRFYVYQTTANNGYMAIDAVGYDWDENYNSWDNCNPYGLLTDVDDNWNVNYRPQTAINILDDNTFHYKVLNMSDWTTASTDAYVDADFSGQNYGTIDFWMKTSSVSYRSMLYLEKDGAGKVWFYINNNKFQWYNYSVYDIPNAGIPQVDTWHHIEIHFCCDSSGYAGLGSDQVRFIIDGIDSGALNIRASDVINGFRIATANDNAGTLHWTLYDAFGYSWDSNYRFPSFNEIPLGSESSTNFTVSSDETIDLWLNGNFTNYLRMMFKRNGNDVFGLKFDENYFYYLDGSVWTKSVYVPNQWEHLSIYFEASTNTWDITLNGTTLGSDMNTLIPFDTIDEFVFEGEYYVNNTFYVDAIGYEWDSGYNVYDNCNPYGIDIINSLESNDWNDVYTTPYSSINMESYLDYHYQVLNLTDNNNNGYCYATYTFDSTTTSGSLEWWYRTTSTSDVAAIRVYDGSTECITLILSNTGTDYYYNGSYNTIQSSEINVWQHWKLIIDTSSDTYDIYVNGNLAVDDAEFRNLGTDISSVKFSSYSASKDYSIYIDAIGYTWNANYDTFDNCNPYGKDIIEELENNDWQIQNNPFSSTTISSSFDSHKKFLNLTDTSETSNTYVYGVKYFGGYQTSGTVSFYINLGYTDEASRVFLGDICILHWDASGDVQYYDGDYHDTGETYSADTWYHVRVNFDCSSAKWWLWIDDVLIESSGYTLSGSPVSFNWIKFYNYRYTTQTQRTYIDALSFSWADTNPYWLGEYNQHCNTESLIDFQLDINFDESNTYILQFNLDSRHFTSTANNMTFWIWNYISEEWEIISNNSKTSEFLNELDLDWDDSETIKEQYFGWSYGDPDGYLRLRYYGYSEQEMNLSIDQLTGDIYYKTTLSYEKTLSLLGTWKYRFRLDVGLGSEHTCDWIYFNVVQETSNFEGISESEYTTRWVLTSTATTGVANKIYEDTFDSGYWSLTGTATPYFSDHLEVEQDSWTCKNVPDTNFDSYGYLRFGYDWLPVPDNQWFTYLGFESGIQDYFDDNTTGVPNSVIYTYGYDTDGGYGDDLKMYLKDTTSFDETTLTWTNQPATGTTRDTNTHDISQWTGWEPWTTGTAARTGYWAITPYGDYIQVTVDNRDHEYGVSSYRPYLLVYINKNYMNTAGGYTYMQAGSSETLGLKSGKLSSDVSLSAGDLFTVEMQTTSDNAQIKLYNEGVLQSTLQLLAFNVETGEQTKEIYVEEDVTFDQVEVVSSLTDTEYLKLLNIRADHWTFTESEDQRSMYVEPFGQNEMIANYGNNSLKIYEKGILAGETYVDIGYDLQTYVFESPLPQDVHVTLYDTNNEYLDFNEFKVYVNYTLKEEGYEDIRLSAPDFYVDEDSYISFIIYDSFDASVSTVNPLDNVLAKSFVDINLYVYTLKIKNEALDDASYTLSKESVEKSGLLFPEDIDIYQVASGSYTFKYIKGDDEEKTVVISLTENRLLKINRSQMCFLSYVNQRGEHLSFEQFKTYWNGTLLYENIFYEDIGNNVSLEIKDLFDISIKNQSFIVSSGDNYIPVVITMYSLKVMNQQELFNHINITRDPNYYESSYSWSEWVAPGEIISFKLFPGYYKINLTDNEGGGSSYYAYTLAGDDILLISSSNLISQVIYNIENVNATIGNQITNVQIDLTNQNSAINNSIINIDIDLSNVNSTLGDLLVNLDVDIENINNNLTSLYLFTNTSFINLNNNMNNSFIYMENNIISINQSISNLVIGVQNDISLINGTISTLIVDMGNDLLLMNTSIHTFLYALDINLTTIGSNIDDYYILLNNSLNLIGNNITNAQLAIINNLMLVNNSISNMLTEIYTSVFLINNSIYTAVLDLGTYLSLINNTISGDLSIVLEQNDFLTELYKMTMFSELLNWTGVGTNTTMLADQVDAWDFINNYKDDAITVFLKYQDKIENLTVSAQNTITQFLPDDDVEYRLYSVANDEYLNEWTALPENKTVDFGFFEADLPVDPEDYLKDYMAIFVAFTVLMVAFLVIVVFIRRARKIGEEPSKKQKKEEVKTYKKNYAFNNQLKLSSSKYVEDRYPRSRRK